MADVIRLILLTFLMLCGFYFLYSQGYMVLKSISAVTFIGLKKGTGASFSSCTGFIKRVIRFKEDGTYTFTLDAELSKGTVSVELEDSAKQKTMQLDSSHGSAAVTVEKKKRYYLIVRFHSATGRYTLTKA